MAAASRLPVSGVTTEVLTSQERGQITARLLKLREIVLSKLSDAKELQDSLGADPVRSKIATKIIEHKRISRPQAVLLFKKELNHRLVEISDLADEIIEAAAPGGLEKLVAGEFKNLSEVWTGDAYDGIEELAGLDEYTRQIRAINISEESIISEIIR